MLIVVPVVSSAAGANSSSGLVPCTNNCGFKDLMTLVNNVINFILYGMVIPIAAIMFAYAGFELVTSGGSTEKRGLAKKVFTNVVIGLIIAVASTIIVKLILSTLGFDASWILF